MFLFAGGQAIAEKVSKKISSYTKRIQKHLQEYNAVPGAYSSLPATLSFEDVSVPTNTVWLAVGKTPPTHEQLLQ